MNIDFYAIEAIRQQQAREHLLAERRARIFEARMDTPAQPSRLMRKISALLQREDKRLPATGPVETHSAPTPITSNALSGD